ncbi:MAG: hypothetical protein V3W04_15665 [Gammaproteobacteria bacterium]
MHSELVNTANKSFKTLRRHRKILAQFYPEKKRAPGYRKSPILVKISPEPDVIPSELPAVRIFVGTEATQFRAERVLIWSILQVRDPARVYEIYLMNDLEGFDRSRWKTGFTNYRYAIPALAGKYGRAIYNDADQIYFTDPARLFDSDMQGNAVLSINDKETSVMLLDCEKLASLWELYDAQHIDNHYHKYFRKKVHDKGLWGNMSPAWNSRDFEYVSGKSHLLHFTTLHTQPWRPFPKVLKYETHELEHLWNDLEKSADEAQFTLFTEEYPSSRYVELIDMYANMHEEGQLESGRTAADTFSGISLVEHIPYVAHLIKETHAKSLLDFGCGKGKLYQDAPECPAGSRFKVMPTWQDTLVTCYDPGYAPYSGLFESCYDAVITTDVVEHIPEEDIPWVLDKLFKHAHLFLYVVAACYPAKKIMPDGSNAHCTQQSPEWWQGQMELTAKRYPKVDWVLCTQEKSVFAFKQRKKLTKKGMLNRFFSGRGQHSDEFRTIQSIRMINKS